jgi:hypothetical protein
VKGRDAERAAGRKTLRADGVAKGDAGHRAGFEPCVLPGVAIRFEQSNIARGWIDPWVRLKTGAFASTQ